MLTPGEILENRYRVDQEIGHGGMGGVYLGTHLQLGVRVAIKQLALDAPIGLDPEAVVRQFQNEARMLHNLHHPQLPRVHDFFSTNGSHYLVMDYIEGRNLNEILTAEGVQPEARLLGWARALCDVLEYLHGQSPPVIFRDLKPSNVMLDGRGQIRLVDFGIAKEFDFRTGHGTMTMARGAISPGFASPEQYGSGTDSRSDIYSLGATLYVLLTHRLPPQSVELAAGAAELIPLQQLRPDVTARTVQAIEWMMQVKAGDRPQSIQQVREALGIRPQTGDLIDASTPPGRGDNSAAPTKPRPRLEDSTIPLSAPPTTLAPAPRAPQPRPVLPIVGGVAAVLILLIGLAMGRSLLHTSGAAPPEASAQLKVTSQPSGATVFLSGKMVGTTPVVLSSLLPLTYEVQLELKGYNSQHQVVSLDKGETGTVQMTLQRAPATLRLSSNLVGTHVQVDGGQPIMTSPMGTTVEVPAGKHKVSFQYAGYVPFNKNVDVKAGDTLHVDATMQKPAPQPTATPPVPAPTRTVVVQPPPTPGPVPASQPQSAGIVPGQFIGRLRLGMTLNDVAAATGVTPARLRQSHTYTVRGFGLVTVGAAERVTVIASSQRGLVTERGIGMGSSRAEVESAYGPPDMSAPRSNGALDVYYRSLGLGFRYGPGQNVQVVLVDHPGGRREFTGWFGGGNAETREPGNRLREGRRRQQ